jgi:hypothetical protein
MDKSMIRRMELKTETGNVMKLTISAVRLNMSRGKGEWRVELRVYDPIDMDAIEELGRHYNQTLPIDDRRFHQLLERIGQ